MCAKASGSRPSPAGVGGEVGPGTGEAPSTPGVMAESRPATDRPLLLERKEPPNLLVCQSWWKNCLVYGDQYKRYKQLHSKTTKLPTLGSKEKEKSGISDELRNEYVIPRIASFDCDSYTNCDSGAYASRSLQAQSTAYQAQPTACQGRRSQHGSITRPPDLLCHADHG